MSNDKQIGFDLPRAAKSARVKSLIKEYGFTYSVDWFVLAYNRRYNESVCRATVQNVMIAMKRNKDASQLSSTIRSIAESVKDLPEDKLRVLLTLSERYGAKVVLEQLKICLIGEEPLI